MPPQPSKVGKNRQWFFFGSAKDSGRYPLDGGINRASHISQIADNECYTMSNIEYKGLDDNPTKGPGWQRYITTPIASFIGGIVDFTDANSVLYSVFYHDGYIYQVTESTGAYTAINSTKLSPAPQYVSLTPFNNKLIIAHGSTLKQWTGSGDISAVSNSPTGVNWVVEHERRLYCDYDGTVGAIRFSDATDETSWPAANTINVGRTAEPLRHAISFGKFLLIFQDNRVDAFDPAAVIAASTLDSWSGVLGDVSRTGMVQCGDYGVAYYTTEGIKFININSATPANISLKVQPILDAIPAGMRSKIAFGWQEGKLRVACSGPANLGHNTIELVCHLEKAIETNGPLVWTGPTERPIALYYTRLSNSGQKNQLLWSDSQYGMIYKRVPDYYSQSDKDGNVSDLACNIITKSMATAPVGYHSWYQEVYMETEGDGLCKLRAQVDNNTSDQVASLAAQSASASSALPWTLPITLSDSTADVRDKLIFWPFDNGSVPQKGKGINLQIEESSDDSFRLIHLAVQAEPDGRTQP